MVAKDASGIISAITNTLRKHIHYGEVKVILKNASGVELFNKSFPAHQAFDLLRDEVDNNGFIALLKQSATPSVEFTGLHNWETIAQNPNFLRVNNQTPIGVVKMVRRHRKRSLK